MTRDFIEMTINGKLHQFRGREAFLPLSDVLRYEIGFTGTKVVCAEGDCGACTLMFSRDMGQTFQSLNSCISSTLLLDGCHIITVEGLVKDGQPSEIQKSMIRNFGGQCGFCTPGFVMSIANMYEQETKPLTEQKTKNYLTGNLCRCTGYTPIVKAAMDVDKKSICPLKKRYDFTAASQVLTKNLAQSILTNWGNKEFFAPASLAEALAYKDKYGDKVRIFSGATDLGVQINKGKDVGQKLMSLHLLEELYHKSSDSEWITIGARVNFQELIEFIKDKAPEFANFLNLFASPQIKNVATLVGNIANGSPIADTTPYLLTADAEVELLSTSGSRTVALSNFILGYKVFDLKPNELISSIRFKIFKSSTKTGVYKISQRRDMDISAVNSSFVFSVESGVIRSARIAFGGVGPKALRLEKLEAILVGKSFDQNLVGFAKQGIADSISPISDVRGTAEFRKLIAQDLFEKYLTEHLS